MRAHTSTITGQQGRIDIAQAGMQPLVNAGVLLDDCASRRQDCQNEYVLSVAVVATLPLAQHIWPDSSSRDSSWQQESLMLMSLLSPATSSAGQTLAQAGTGM